MGSTAMSGPWVRMRKFQGGGPGMGYLAREGALGVGAVRLHLRAASRQVSLPRKPLSTTTWRSASVFREEGWYVAVACAELALVDVWAAILGARVAGRAGHRRCDGKEGGEDKAGQHEDFLTSTAD